VLGQLIHQHLLCSDACRGSRGHGRPYKKPSASSTSRDPRPISWTWEFSWWDSRRRTSFDHRWWGIRIVVGSTHLRCHPSPVDQKRFPPYTLFLYVWYGRLHEPPLKASRAKRPEEKEVGEVVNPPRGGPRGPPTAAQPCGRLMASQTFRSTTSAHPKPC
jgi:hypothetical protein